MSVSNSKSKYVAYLSVLSQISNCQSLGRKNKHDILKTDRTCSSAQVHVSEAPRKNTTNTTNTKNTTNTTNTDDTNATNTNTDSRTNTTNTTNTILTY